MSISNTCFFIIPIICLLFAGESNVLSAEPVVAQKSSSEAVKKDWQQIDSLFSYDGNDLGCTFYNSSAIFKLWAPKATSVKVILYDKNDQTRIAGEKKLEKSNSGVWEAELKPSEFPGITDLRGYFYQYEVINPGRSPRIVLDPYSKSMAAVTVDTSGNSAGKSGDFVGKAAIVNPSAVGKKLSHPKIDGYKKREDAIIWEIHTRDFTSDPSIEKDLTKPWGTYRAFISKIPYIKSLGVTHVQLLPVQAWYFGDESLMTQREMKYSSKNNQYNWGYDPHNYFSPDGAYSENPDDPECRIAEIKDLIDAIHQAGMGVILDVVYTHMAKAEFLDDIVPGYYFFQDSEGKFLGDFGNNLATNRKMAEKLLVDSVTHWFSEYKIDGMRFDMMGDATYDAIQHAYNAAAAINPDALFLGEGWRTFKGHLDEPLLKGKAADQDWMDKTDNVGVFSDEFRNELKSGFGCEGEPRFITGGKRDISLIFANLKAQPTNTPADAPGDMVQYIEAHDNLPLYDVIAQSLKKDPDLPENDLEIHKRIRIGNLLLLTAQGTAFIHAGQEYGRTKQWRSESEPEAKFHKLVNEDGTPFKFPYFIHDSYDSSDAINMFDWKKATDGNKYPANKITREYTTGLIAFRKSTDAFRLPSKAIIDQNVRLIDAPEIEKVDLVIAYSCTSTSGEKYYIFVNADNRERKLTLSEDFSKLLLICDAEKVDLKGISEKKGVEISGKTITLLPLSSAIFKD
ncbi:MAG: hypothetical protein HQM10_23085 [Candidatus Riflebacteria bacterium]|nr:hypothetical protein [Candidatus Riflebacteria bacterium]